MPERSDAAIAAAGAQSPQSPHTPRYQLLQVLRAIAALMVVGHHATILLKERLDAPTWIWMGGTAGVDIFFVISGFVMTISSARVLGSSGAMWNFLLRRLERVVPLYWIVTTVKLGLLLVLPAMAINPIGSGWHVVSSYLFLPSLGPTGTLEPLVIVGWTLNLEMLFYVLFAVALGLRLPLLSVLAPPLLVLTGLSLFRLPLPTLIAGWADPILPEFLLGVLLGRAVMRGWVPGFWAGLLLTLFGFGTLVLTPASFYSPWRSVLWGLPAVATVIGMIAMERVAGDKAPRWMLATGDASYSIYLTHGFVLPVLGMALAPLHWTGDLLTYTTLGAALLLSALFGRATYLLLERPIMRWFQRRRIRQPLSAAI